MVTDTIRNSKTICELFLNRAHESNDQTAYEYEVEDTWFPVTWTRYAEHVRNTALGLKSVGMGPGERVAVWGDTMPEWTIVDLATMALGGCTAGIYQTNTPEQAAYIINDAATTVVVVDSPARLEQALSIREKTPSVKFYVTWGEGEDESNKVYSLDSLMKRGEAFAQKFPGAFGEIVGEVTPDTTAVLVYTSGTTGPPKGAMLSHKNCMFCCRGVYDRMPNEKRPNGADAPMSSLSFLPLSHVAEHVCGFLSRIYYGGTAYFMPDLDRFVEVAQLKSPTLMGAVPRLYEKVYAAIMEKTESASPVRRVIFNWAIRTGTEVARYRMQEQPVPLSKAIAHRWADKLVLSKIRDVLGGKVEFMVCGAAPIAKEIIDFYNAAGLAFMEVYGMTESTGISHMNYYGKYKAGTVGTTLPGYECKLAEDGEILVRGDGVFQGYLNQPEATAEAIDSEGWLHTGDIGEEDEEGFLRITDRKKNLIITAGGKNVAPTNIELLISRDPLVSQVVVIGDRRKFLSALITVSTEELEKLQDTPEYRGKSLDEIVASERIQNRIREAVDKANAELARYENIRKYHVLPREFSIEEDEMTPTMKLKRRVIEKRFADIIEGFYVEAG